MAFTTQDLDKGLDFTGLGGSATAANHNQLADQAAPHADSASEGKGIVLWSIDSALNTPSVPDPTIGVPYNKFKRYIWLRIPHSTSTSTTPIFYGWNDSIVSVATYLKWISSAADLTGLQAQINTALANAASAQTIANNASATAGVAAVQAAAALATANAASVTAGNAATNATTALTNAATAQNTANNADATATAALAAANTKKTPNNALTPGTAGQEVRTNSAATSAEWFSRIDTYIKITEIQNKGTNAGASVVGKNMRVLNNEDNDSGALATLAAGIVTLVTGTYYIKARTTSNDIDNVLLLVVRNSDNTTLLTGSPYVHAGGAFNENVFECVEGVITIAAATAIRLDQYLDSINANGLGRAANIHPDAGGKEVYTVLEIWKIG